MFVAAWPIAEGSGKKVLMPICVTTRRRNLWVLNNLRCELRPLAARFLRLGMPGSGRGILAVFGLPPGRLPAADLPQAFRLLTVTLVPAPRQVLTPALFAQANPRTRSAPSGLDDGVFAYLGGRPREELLPREKLGENASTFSPSAIKSRITRLLASLPCSWEQDR